MNDNAGSLRAQLDAVSLSGTGSFDLLAQDFDTTFKARLSPGLEELDPACRVSKRLTAIDFPVNCFVVSPPQGGFFMSRSEKRRIRFSKLLPASFFILIY